MVLDIYICQCIYVSINYILKIIYISYTEVEQVAVAEEEQEVGEEQGVVEV